jgi:outer membrane protein assembly factor BamB
LSVNSLSQEKQSKTTDMKKRKLKYGLAFLMAILYFGQAQAQDAMWQLDFEKEILYNKITESGILLIGTSDFKFHGIDSRDGNKLWTSDIFKGAKALRGPDGKKIEAKYAFDTYINILEDSEYPEISDFVEIKYTDAAGMYKNYAILNMHTGEEVISPRKAGMPIMKMLGKEMATFNIVGTGYIPELRMVIISASWIDYTQKEQPTVFITKMVELPSAKVIWTNEEVASENFPFVLNNGDIILPGKTKIARMDPKTGNVKWEYNTSHKKQFFESFDMNLALTKGYFFEKKKSSGSLSAIDLETGNKIWENEMKLKIVPTMTAMGYGVVINDGKNFVLYDLASGAEKWSIKKVDGTVIDLGDNGIAVTTKGTRLVLLNKNDGSVIWDQKIKGIQIDQITAKGIMYSDIKGRVGLIQYDGELVWNKKGMLEVPSLRYKPELTKELMYIDGTLYEIDLIEGTYNVLFGKLDDQFKGEEAPASIELVDGGYLISSPQNMILLETDGSVRWQKYWEAPGMSMAAKIALRVGQVAMVAMAASASASSAQSRSPYGGSTYYSKMYAQQAEDLSKAAGALGAEAKKTFSASLSKGNIKMVLTKVGAGGQAASSGIVKIEKNTGDEMGSLLLGDKEPIYDYDPLSGQVFFKADKKQIISYSL